MVRRLIASLLLLLLLLLSLTACGSTAPAPDAGRYLATRFLVTPPGGAAADWLGGGAVFDVTIAESQTTSGRFFVPAALAGGAEIEEELTGVALADDAGRVQFVFRPADIFLESLRFVQSGETLIADSLTTDGVRVALTLTRQR